ncbi:hypothetical protein TIFTF001_024532 [Ficus carica]|uniref:Uncharacterized protein n=1 Tax=Ficus carica TaxID=3494 RepID=A0AA88DKD9_FICCA|nr:hypothetical protein TIFTF001_024532 [Ficus carica]
MPMQPRSPEVLFVARSRAALAHPFSPAFKAPSRPRSSECALAFGDPAAMGSLSPILNRAVGDPGAE